MALLIEGIGQLVTNDPTLGDGPLGLIRDAAVVVEGDAVAWVGPRAALRGNAADSRWDAGGRAVLPGFVENSLGVLKLIAEQLSPNLHISLMSQYYPPDRHVAENRNSQIVNRKSLHRPLTRPEYETVIEAFHALGFTRGWLQEYESHQNYRPDFSKEHPFE